MAGFLKMAVVYDYPYMCDVSSCPFGASGFQAGTTEDGLPGLKTAGAKLSDLSITSIEIPRLDGVQMAGRSREQSGFGKAPGLVISACSNRAANGALKAGAGEAKHKPIDFTSLFGCIIQLLTA
jgi:DNA-binding response OmpR family regulator